MTKPCFGRAIREVTIDWVDSFLMVNEISSYNLICAIIYIYRFIIISMCIYICMCVSNIGERAQISSVYSAGQTKIPINIAHIFQQPLTFLK